MSGHDQSLQKLIEGIRFAMFTTRGPDDTLHSRPMTTQNPDADEPDAGKWLWFFMARSSEPVRDLSARPLVNVSYANPGKDAYVSVSGTARLVEDRAIKRRLWSTMNEVWFPKGVDDPDHALVCVQVDGAEYWNIKESKLMQMAKMAKAVITGERPTDIGEHGRLESADPLMR